MTCAGHDDASNFWGDTAHSTVPSVKHSAPELQAVVRSKIIDIVGIDTLHNDTTLSDAGVDSLAAQEFRRTLATHLSVSLTPLLIFDYPTIS